MDDGITKRFETKFDKDPVSGCWNWNAGRNKSGYGAFWVSEVIGNKRAHRVAYKIYKGSIPEDLWVLHRCDNPGCVNPDHLFLGTPKTNHQDMVKKNRRSIQGETHPLSKMTAAAVVEARTRYHNGESCSSLAKVFGVNKKSMRQILYGKHWPNAGGPTGKPRGVSKGERHVNAKLTADLVREARQRNKRGESGADLAKAYGVSHSVMCDALRRRSWKHVD